LGAKYRIAVPLIADYLSLRILENMAYGIKELLTGIYKSVLRTTLVPMKRVIKHYKSRIKGSF